MNGCIPLHQSKSSLKLSLHIFSGFTGGRVKVVELSLTEKSWLAEPIGVSHRLDLKCV